MNQWVKASVWGLLIEGFDFGGHFVTVELKVSVYRGFWLRRIRAFRGFDKNQIGKVVLVGPGSRACHMLLYSVYFNSILASEGNICAIRLV